MLPKSLAIRRKLNPAFFAHTHTVRIAPILILNECNTVQLDVQHLSCGQLIRRARLLTSRKPSPNRVAFNAERRCKLRCPNASLLHDATDASNEPRYIASGRQELTRPTPTGRCRGSMARLAIEVQAIGHRRIAVELSKHLLLPTHCACFHTSSGFDTKDYAAVGIMGQTLNILFTPLSQVTIIKVFSRLRYFPARPLSRTAACRHADQTISSPS